MIIRLPVLHAEPEGGEIPKILHQVWVGSAVPKWVRDLWAKWEEFLGPEWTVKHWTDENRDQWPLTQRIEGCCQHPVVVADFIRLEQVWKYGGVYMDSDTVPLRPLDRWVGRRPAWVAGGGWPQPEGEKPDLNNAIFGFPPQNRLVVDIWGHAWEKVQRLKNPYYIAGPKVWETYVYRKQHPYKVEVPPWNVFPDLPKKHKTPGLDLSIEALKPLVPESAVAVHLAHKSWFGENTVVTQTPTFIMAIPWDFVRKQRAQDLQAQTGGKVVWDKTHHAFETWRSVLAAVGDGPAIIIEDDVVLVDDWRNRIEAVIAEHRDEVIQFFSMRGKDLTVGSRYEAASSFMMNQCYYLPAGAAKALLSFTESWVAENPEHPTGYDVAMSRWLSSRKQRYWLSVPSLVQHEAWRSEINPRRPRNRQSMTFEGA